MQRDWHGRGLFKGLGLGLESNVKRLGLESTNVGLYPSLVPGPVNNHYFEQKTGNRTPWPYKRLNIP